MSEPISCPKKRILYLTKVFPYEPAGAGDSVYSRGVIEAWSTVANVTVLCADSGARRRFGQRRVNWQIVDPPRTTRAGSVMSVLPLIAWKGATRAYRQELSALLRQNAWDAIVLDNIGVAFALPKARSYRRKYPTTKLVYVSHEWEYPTRAGKYRSYKIGFWKKLAAAFDLRKVRHWENALIRHCNIVTVINPADADSFRTIDPAPKYLPILPGYDGPVVTVRDITEAVPRRVLILGGRRSEQKQQVLLDWLHVAYERLESAGIETLVVGDIPDKLRAQIVEDYPRVEVVGFAEDLGAVIKDARAGLIVDTVGSGFKLRLLSHVFQRLPVVGLSGAIVGLPTPEGEGYLAAPTLADLVDLVCTALEQPDLLDAVQKRAFVDCEQEFSWAERAQVLRKAVGH
ncbi:glycosyltransferase [Sinomonas soli]